MRPDDRAREAQRLEVRVGVDQRASEFAVFDRRLGKDHAICQCGVLDGCVVEYLDVLAQIGVRQVGARMDVIVAVEFPGDGVRVVGNMMSLFSRIGVDL